MDDIEAQADKPDLAEQVRLEKRAAHNATVDAGHEARKRNTTAISGGPLIAEPAPAAAEAPQMRAQNEKPAPCPCQEPGAVTLEQIDQRIAALARLVVIGFVAAAVAYVLAGRKEEIEG